MKKFYLLKDFHKLLPRTEIQVFPPEKAFTSAFVEKHLTSIVPMTKIMIFDSGCFLCYQDKLDTDLFASLLMNIFFWGDRQSQKGNI